MVSHLWLITSKCILYRVPKRSYIYNLIITIPIERTLLGTPRIFGTITFGNIYVWYGENSLLFTIPILSFKIPTLKIMRHYNVLMINIIHFCFCRVRISIGLFSTHLCRLYLKKGSFSKTLNQLTI
uniref:Uncharacterized protein n=1 Tax=Cacopsylla melanoneura TaxID=428564 RepID=A0A8D9BJ68_9HEMI